MSYLDNQRSTFKASVQSSSQKIANKRSVPLPGNSTPLPASSQTSTATKSDTKKRKPPEPSNIVYSQPADTGTGKNIKTQVTYAVEYLKTKGTPQTLQDLLLYLSLQYHDNNYKRAITAILKDHSKVLYDKHGGNGKGSFSFKPIYNIRSAVELFAHLQKQPTAQGLLARDLRDGWPDAEDVMRDLEDEGKLLVTRNKKDDHAKMVWLNDPSLVIPIDEEFKSIWHKIRLPEAGALADELEKAQLMPTNKSRGFKAKTKLQEKKIRKPRKSGKTTNVHMQGILRDYSNFRK